MGIGQIDSPGNPPAFGSAGQDTVQAFSPVLQTVPSNGVITAGNIVVFTASATGSSGIVTCTQGTAGTTALAGGVALDSASTAGVLVRVVTHGPVIANTGTTTFANGSAFSCGAGSVPAAASTVIGSNFGIAMVNTVASSAAWVWVGKM